MDQNIDHDETTPLVRSIQEKTVDTTAKLLDALLDKAGYGIFHVILLIGKSLLSLYRPLRYTLYHVLSL